VIISLSVLGRKRNVSDKLFRETHNTLLMFNNNFFPEIRTVHEIVWKNTPAAERPQMTTYDGACTFYAG
jgi:hypothetical protein